MDPITKTRIDKVLADLANDSGGTYQAGTFLPQTWDSGFAVATERGLSLPAEWMTPSMLAWAIRQVSRENPGTSFVGTWLDKGVVFVDAVVYYAADRREAAIAAGRAAGQVAIYDFGEKASIILYATEERYS